MRIDFIQWTSKSIGNKHCLHPTFTHGSTLGLYEVLAGKPCICDIVTDSVVLCVFIEAEKILAALKSDPAVEDFFWQVYHPSAALGSIVTHFFYLSNLQLMCEKKL